MPRIGFGIWFLGLTALFVLGACEEMYPEVVVVNRTNEHILIKNASFNGCLWNQEIAFDEATSPGRCLPGDDKVHFQKFDAEAYCQEQAEDAGVDSGLVNEEPTWFNYQTISVKSVDYGDFELFEITLDDMEQDFSAPGPYGH
jgi:hypothetical protein